MTTATIPTADLGTGLLVLDEEQELLAQAARELVEGEAPLARFRALRDAGDVFDRPLWQHLTALGWPAVAIPEDRGGLGLGLAGAVVLLEALGRTLAPTPLVSCLMAGVLESDTGGGTEGDTGGGIPDGAVVALAWQEDPRTLDPGRVTARWQAGRLTGRKLAVLDATAADRFLVSALDGDRVRLFSVAAADVDVQPLRRIDHRDAGHVVLDGAPATPLDAGLDALRLALDHGTVGLCAEMLGGAASALDLTLAWLHQREQFGKPIGSFQVLKHRAVDCFIAVEQARSAVMAAARNPSPALVSLAKARCGESFLHVAREAIQLHGGIGMTDEHDIGFFLKRAAVAEQTLGDQAWHRDRWARLHGY